MPFKSNKQRKWMHANKPEMAKKWEKEFKNGGYNMKEYEGGNLIGNSHEQGGIPIEAEGGEYIIKKDSVNRSTLDTLEYINKHGDLPMSNAKDRRNK
jgi:hypothetical protein